MTVLDVGGKGLHSGDALVLRKLLNPPELGLILQRPRLGGGFNHADMDRMVFRRPTCPHELRPGVRPVIIAAHSSESEREACERACFVAAG